MEAILLIVAMITLIISMMVLSLLAIILFRMFEQDMQIFPSFAMPKLRGKKENTADSKDTYTPQGTEENLDLDSFEPDFNKPLTVKVGEETATIGEAVDTDEGLHELGTTDVMQDPDEPVEVLK